MSIIEYDASLLDSEKESVHTGQHDIADGGQR